VETEKSEIQTALEEAEVIIIEIEINWDIPLLL
jgi:hypothetical protein